MCFCSRGGLWCVSFLNIVSVWVPIELRIDNVIICSECCEMGDFSQLEFNDICH